MQGGTVSYVVRVAGSDAVVASADDLVFTLGEGHLIPALQAAVKTMKKGEAVALKVKPESPTPNAAYTSRSSCISRLTLPWWRVGEAAGAMLLG
ncbi:Peptidyl-prolyl cis-trans isomerase FKBP65 [Tetrabaena socialis]|uniref:Rotamase n=1 Tax=Tetrabaena socialis TaxID=47790 RepID=A0A2J7ZS72_9CHLO|nr:Peptidyl-prolyl cis-trans isomerase FKBP65 [Tetrabaena socialis]|eukprot:PNH03121.1 Peptidyl-prolyl cis-trans isomerase FKBP65 [Tetrabaena socialis]